MVLAAATFIAGLGITWIVWQAEKRDIDLRARTRFEFTVEEITSAITARMGTYEQVLRGGASLINTLGGATRAQWRDYVGHLELHASIPGIQDVGYAQCVQAADLPAFVRHMQDQGLQDYAVHPPGDRPLVCVVTYLEPHNGQNLRSHGFDMLSEPLRRAALLQARDSGRATLTRQLDLTTLAQTPPARGFLMVMPVYRPGAPVGDVAQRRAALLGFVSSPFRIGDLMAAVMKGRDAGIDVGIDDHPRAPAAALMQGAPASSNPLAARAPGAQFAELPITLQDRAWTLQFRSTPAFDAGTLSSPLRTIAGAGLGISVLMACVAWLASMRLLHTRLARERFKLLAHFDHLTGLPNRAMFHQRLGEVLAQASRDDRRAALLFIDLDNFKFVNDSAGHAAGDNLLKAIAHRLTETARQNDVVCRLGGDEFTLILGGIHESAEVAAIAERLVEAMAQPFDVGGRQVVVTVSIGIAMYPDDGADVGSLLRNADSAMYRAKEAGKQQYQFFTDEMNAAASRRVAVEALLRTAVLKREFQLAYQPVVDLRDGRLVGLEALLRLPQSGPNPVSTGELIATAEQCGLIGAIGDFVIDSACQQLAAWPGAKAHGIKLAINVSARQFHDKNLARRIRDAVARAGADASLLELELTESAFLGGSDEAQRILQELRATGVSIALDDFGTGYSSLAYLKRFPIDKIKIDRSFVSEIGSSEDEGAIVKAIIALGDSLRMMVVAEGIETQVQLDSLGRFGCHYGQGFHFAQAITPQALGQRYGALLGVAVDSEPTNSGPSAHLGG